MVGTRMMEQLGEQVELAGSKLVCIGDHQQLQAINAGAPFRWMVEHIGASRMAEIVRQRAPWARRAVLDFAGGNALSALEEYYARGQLFIDQDRTTAIARLVGDWHDVFLRDADTISLTSTRLETTSVNRLCQAIRLESGQIGGARWDVGHETLYRGDRVIFTKNQPALLVRNGTRGTVIDTEPMGNELVVRLDSGLTTRIDLGVYDAVSLGYAVNVHRAQGTTVESAFVLAGGSMTDRELSYVQGSRARGETRIYTDVVYGGPDIEAIAIQMNRSRPKDMAHEYLREVV
jgi:ATP-dependent exoDNAse (exonuclease V) alpha subunit